MPEVEAEGVQVVGLVVDDEDGEFRQLQPGNCHAKHGTTIGLKSGRGRLYNGKPAAEVALSDRRHGLVLVVDDDDDIRESLEVLLRLHGYHVATAADGAEALARLKGESTRPCVILLDLMMPGMNGFELRSELTAHQDLAEIPVVVITGAGAKVAERASAMQLDVLRKPFEPLALLQKVRRFCLGGAAATGP